MDLRLKHITGALLLSREMREFADQGTADSPDEGCFLVYGVIRDCAYKIQSVAEQQLRRDSDVAASCHWHVPPAADGTQNAAGFAAGD